MGMRIGRWIVLGAAAAIMLATSWTLGGPADDDKTEMKAPGDGMMMHKSMARMMLAKLEAMAGIDEALEAALAAANDGDAAAAAEQIAEAQARLAALHEQMHKDMTKMHKRITGATAAMHKMAKKLGTLSEHVEGQTAEGMAKVQAQLEKMAGQMAQECVMATEHGKPVQVKCPMCEMMLGAPAGEAVINSRCPISGKPIDSANVPQTLVRQFAGESVGFCCPACPSAWEKLSEEEKEARLEAAMDEE